MSAVVVAGCSALVDTSGLSGGTDAPNPTPADATAALDGTPSDAPGPADGATDDSSVAIPDTGTDASSVAYRDAVLADGPLAYYRLAETGGTVAKDQVGAHDGSYIGSSNQYHQPGPAPSVPSVRFKASGHVSAGGLSLLPVGTFASYTLEMFVASEVPAGTSSFFLSFGTTIGASAPNLWIDDATQTYRYSSRGSIIDATSNIGTAWHHLAITSTGTTVKIYVDGVLDISGTVNDPTPERGLFTIGTNTSGADAGGVSYGSSFQGRLAEVAVYGKALDVARIAAHYAARP